MDFTQSMDNGYMIPASVAVGSGEATDIRCVCDTVEDFKAFLDSTGMDLRYEGLVTYEKTNKLLKVYKGGDVWEAVGKGEINNENINTSNFVTLTQLSQHLDNYYTKIQVDNKISEEISKIKLDSESSSGLSDLLCFDDLFVDRSVASFVDDTIIKQDYLGGYIEIQPDSWDGENTAVDSVSKTWGFPMSLLNTEQTKMKNKVLHGNGANIMYIRMPLGFAYRGYRNIDEVSGLAKNIGERFKGQNSRLREFFKDISTSGGGLAPEYWCPPPYWLTSGSYHGDNQIRAGGDYPQTATLSSIRNSDPSQYNSQINAFTDAIVDDLEYLHINIAPVRMFGLQNEPIYGQMAYGACKYDHQTYNDVLEVLYPKLQNSKVLSEYNDEKNEIKLIVASSDENHPFEGIAKTFIDKHSDWIWGYAHHSMRQASGELSGLDVGADWYKTDEFSKIKGNKTNVFINEYEYFSTDFGTDEFRCSNNMLHLINELVYGEAQVLHPIIHICKPLGQSLYQTNTKGYCMFEVNLKGEYGISQVSSTNPYGLNKGTYKNNDWVYNSWSLFADNLPVGAYLVGSYENKIDNAGWCVYKYCGKLHIFFANNSDKNVSINLNFKEIKSFKGKMYSMDYCGKDIKEKTGDSVSFVVPAYSGQFWVEETLSIIEPIPCESITLSDESLSLTSTQPYFISAIKYPSNSTDPIIWKTSNPSVANVNNGGIVPVSNGECVITASCGVASAICSVSVDIPVNNGTLSLELGGINYQSGQNEFSDCKYRTDFISVDKGKLVIDSDLFKNGHQGGFGFVCRNYNSSKEFIGSSPSQLTSEGGTYDLMPGTRYIRIVFAHTLDSLARPNIKNEDVIFINEEKLHVNII